MKCEDVSERLSAFLDGELPVSVAADIRRHLDGCERCAAQYARESIAWTLVVEQPWVSPRADLWPRIEAGLREPAAHTVWGGLRWHPFPVATAALAAAGLLLGVQLGTYVASPDGLAATTAGSSSRERIDVQYLADVFPGSLADSVLNTPVGIPRQEGSR